MPSENVKRILAARHQSGLFNAFPSEKAGPQGPDSSNEVAADNKKKKKSKKKPVKASKQIRAYNADHVKGDKYARSISKKQLTASQGLQRSASKKGKETHVEADANHNESYVGGQKALRNKFDPDVLN